MKRALAITIAAVAILMVSSAGYAEKRPHEGKIIRVETVEKSADIQGQNVASVERSMVI